MLFMIGIILVVLLLTALTAQNNDTVSHIRDDVSDYDVLLRYLKDDIKLFPEHMSHKQIDKIVAMYIDYFCRIHIGYILELYPPSYLADEYRYKVYDNFFKGHCSENISRNIIGKLKQVGSHPKLDDIYNDTLTALRLSRNDIWFNSFALNKAILDALCDKTLILKYVRIMEKEHAITLGSKGFRLSAMGRTLTSTSQPWKI